MQQAQAQREQAVPMGALIRWKAGPLAAMAVISQRLGSLVSRASTHTDKSSSVAVNEAEVCSQFRSSSRLLGRFGVCLDCHRRRSSRSFGDCKVTNGGGSDFRGEIQGNAHA